MQSHDISTFQTLISRNRHAIAFSYVAFVWAVCHTNKHTHGCMGIGTGRVRLTSTVYGIQNPYEIRMTRGFVCHTCPHTHAHTKGDAVLTQC
eukprot:4968261-Prymnesium_polylepis.1